MSTIADRVRTAQDKDGMLRRALERIIQLYTDKSHFVYELLQNAEDAEAKSIKFIQYPPIDWKFSMTVGPSRLPTYKACVTSANQTKWTI